VARPIWTGVISFGLVTIPVRLVSVVREKDVSFHTPVSPAPVVDLMDALRGSVEQARSRRKSA
jgi:non-homologous end joining protein Ku